MTRHVIIDTGPALNFIASGHHELLFSVLDARNLALHMPETIVDEVEGKAERDSRFRRCGYILKGLIVEGRVTLLQDDIESEDLNAAVEVVCGSPLTSRIETSKDLGETLVIAHGIVLRNSGHKPLLLIDERDGFDKAVKLELATVTSIGILVVAAKYDIVPKLRSMRRIYNEIEKFDLAMGGWTTPGNPLLNSKLYGSAVNRP